MFCVDVHVYKCLGHEYSHNDGEATTFYVVLPENAIGGTLALGDVIAGNHTDGFLEQVVEKNKEVDSVFVHTELSHCMKNSTQGKRLVKGS